MVSRNALCKPRLPTLYHRIDLPEISSVVWGRLRDRITSLKF